MFWLYLIIAAAFGFVLGRLTGSRADKREAERAYQELDRTLSMERRYGRSTQQ